jgi:hypothetical protein
MMGPQWTLARLPLTAITAGAILVAVPQRPALPQGAVQLVVVDVTAVAAGFRASKLIGSTVNNDKNDKIGSIDDLVVGRDKVLFAILQVGGFLGLGGHLVAVPYSSLVLGDGTVQLPGASKDALKALPEFKYKP